MLRWVLSIALRPVCVFSMFGSVGCLLCVVLRGLRRVGARPPLVGGRSGSCVNTKDYRYRYLFHSERKAFSFHSV